MNKHSAGQWDVYEDSYDEWPTKSWGIMLEGHITIAEVLCVTDMETTLANVRLISAAPDLYKALRMICDSGVNLSNSLKSEVLAALDKAEGKGEIT